MFAIVKMNVTLSCGTYSVTVGDDSSASMSLSAVRGRGGRMRMQSGLRRLKKAEQTLSSRLWSLST